MNINENQTGNPSHTLPLIVRGDSVVTETVFEVRSPTSNQLLYNCSSSSIQDAAEAVKAAQEAFSIWGKLTPYARRDILLKAAEIMVARKEELIRYQMEETGAGRSFSEFTFDLGVDFLKDFACRIPTIQGDIPSVNEKGEAAMILKEPYGVILTIAPWNAPYMLGTRGVALPLAAGNTVVLKGSELSPKCFWALGDIYREAGLPARALNVLYSRTSDAADVTTALIGHPAVRKVNFTGSTQVGTIIATIAAKFLKPTVLELGGKASAIVLDDANLEKAASACALGAFMHSGQVCMSTERIIVLHSIADRFLPLLIEAVEKAFGRNTQAPTLIGPSAVRKNKALINDALQKGAAVLYGELNEEDGCSTSMRPVIVGHVTKDMDIYKTESFGPTVSFITVESEEDAVAVANDTEYGLTAAVFSENLARAFRVAKQLESGAVHINSLTVHDEPTLPHGGWKSSGYGRFGGIRGYDEFLQTKTITWRELSRL
ncbi:hypothetical protein CFD26_104439 [Aspergillus turcosus]|uniref:Aldehyde dehydrogenase domain-containing protein n=1 Tax=Aspergillus turcosus TaxID=1245748 RepID=A0A421DB07_9EURO|nr:hypothetical protein CFD26_104439 [Aspergillus turcosus]